MTAKLLAQDGAAVAVNARRRALLDGLVAEILAFGGQAMAAAGDMSVRRDVDHVLQRVLQWDAGGNKYDIVVVNAGRGLSKGMLDSDESQWEALCKINLLGAASLMRRAGKYMAERRSGDIVVVGSVVGRQSTSPSDLYGATKLAVGSLTEALRREVCGKGVRVSLVMPGVVQSDFQNVGGYGEEYAQWTDAMGRLLDPGDVGEGIRWLLSLPSHVNVNELLIRPTGQCMP